MYYITKGNPDGTRDTVKTINGSLEDALQEFDKSIEEQVYEFRIAKTIKQWRILRLHDEDGNILRQES